MLARPGRSACRERSQLAVPHTSGTASRVRSCIPARPDAIRPGARGHVRLARAHDRRMNRDWTPLAIAYLALALIGLVGTWLFNAFAIVQMRDYLGDLVSSGPAVSSITVDLLVVAVAGCVLIVAESRRLGMRRAWWYIVLSGVTAFAFTFPLFLAMRQRRITHLARAAAPAEA